MAGQIFLVQRISCEMCINVKAANECNVHGRVALSHETESFTLYIPLSDITNDSAKSLIHLVTPWQRNKQTLPKQTVHDLADTFLSIVQSD